MRRDDLHLNDIIEAADHIAVFLGEMDFGGFLKSELVRSAIVQKLAIIGEQRRGSRTAEGSCGLLTSPGSTMTSVLSKTTIGAL